LSLHHLQHPVLEDLRQERKARAARRVALAARAKVLVPGQGKVQAQARPANHLLPLLLLPPPVCILQRLLVARRHRRHLNQRQAREQTLLHLRLRLPWAKLLHHRPLLVPTKRLPHPHLLQQAVP
jgi:hypothetical protein